MVNQEQILKILKICLVIHFYYVFVGIYCLKKYQEKAHF